MKDIDYCIKHDRLHAVGACPECFADVAFRIGMTILAVAGLVLGIAHILNLDHR